MLARLAGREPFIAALTLVNGEPDALAKKHGGHKKNKTTVSLRYQGSTIRKRQVLVRKWLCKGATRGACGRTPVCDNVTCGGNDGCGGVCGRAAASGFFAGTCTACTLHCNGNAATCANALSTALEAAPTLPPAPSWLVSPAVVPR